MSIEQAVLEKLQALPLDKQQEVLDFAEFLHQKFHKTTPEPQRSQPAQTPLGQKLRELRAEIVASGERLLTAEEIEQEILEQRDRFRSLEDV